VNTGRKRRRGENHLRQSTANLELLCEEKRESVAQEKSKGRNVEQAYSQEGKIMGNEGDKPIKRASRIKNECANRPECRLRVKLSSADALGVDTEG